MLLIKIDTVFPGKPGNFNSLREEIWLILWHYYLAINWKWASVPKKVLWLLTSLRWYVWGMSLKLLNHTSRHCFRNSSELSEELLQGFIIIRMRTYLLKGQLQNQPTEKSFCICLWSNNQVLSKFYYLLIFSPCFN